MQRMMGGRVSMDVPSFDDGGSGGDGTSGFYSDSFTPPVYTTNDLWLQITGTTNFGTNLTAHLVIHPRGM